MTPEDAAHVTGIKIDGGLPLLWEVRDASIDGKNYKMFGSPYPFTVDAINIEVVWDK